MDMDSPAAPPGFPSYLAAIRWHQENGKMGRTQSPPAEVMHAARYENPDESDESIEQSDESINLDMDSLHLRTANHEPAPGPHPLDP